MKEKFTKFLVLFFSLLTLNVSAQQKKISGTVTAKSDGLPIPGVSIQVKGTSQGAQTNVDGKFSISIEEGATISFAYLGFRTKDVKVGTSTVLNVVLEADQQQLNEIVVTALGVTRQQRSLGYSTTKIKTEELTAAKSSNVIQGLNGKVAGLQINTVNNGVNAQTRVILRGNRSLTGNNTALIVLDGVVVPASTLNTINPDDVDNVTVLKGASAAALYGSEASNGALVYTTKKGNKTAPKVTYSNATTFEQLSFIPKLQQRFGSGSADGTPVYDPIENQQYGPEFDGTLRPIGKPLEDKSQQQVTYVDRTDEKMKFWDTGLNMQNNFSVSTGSENSLLYFSYQNVQLKGITPEDKGKRNTFRLNGSREIGKFTMGFNSSFTQNKFDIQSNLDRDNSTYWNVINTPGQIPLTQYRNWKTDKFANPNGYFNDYYDNPYYKIDNWRTDARSEYYIGNIDLGYKVAPWFNVGYRLGITANNNSSKDHADKFTYTDYAKSVSSSKKDDNGNVTDFSSFVNQVSSDLLLNFDKKFGDFSTKLILGNNVRQNTSKFTSISANSLVNPGVFNVANRVGELTGYEDNYKSRSFSAFGDLTLGYKDYLFLQVTGRNDWVSVLSPANRSFFYPSVNLSYVFTDGIEALKNNSILTYGKIRAGYAKVGQVNLLNTDADGNVGTFGAYNLLPTFAASQGFPYGSLSGYTLSNRLVSNNLKPEFTSGYEVGAELGFANDLLNLELTYYDQSSTNQTVTAGVSRTTGYSSFLLNSGEVSNKGYEVDVKSTPVRLTNGFKWSVNANYNYNDNKVVSITDSIKELALSTGGNAQVYAIAGQGFPVIKGSYYERDPEGRVLVDPSTGYPIKAADQKIFGSTTPKHKLGVGTSFAYKGFTLSGLFEYRGGYVVYNSIGSDLDFEGGAYRTGEYGRQRFVYPNSAYKDPVTGKYVANTNITVSDGSAGFWANSAYNTSVAENYVTSGAYWKLRELVFSYEFPSAMLSKVKYVKGLTLSLVGRNLFTWLPASNMYTDPEFNFTNTGNAVGINSINQTPPTRTYGASLSVTF